MNAYGLRIEIHQGEIKEILEELTAAQETILKCYERLDRLGVITIIEKPSAATDGNED